MTAPARGATTAERDRFRSDLGGALAVLGHEVTWAEGHGIGHLAGYPGDTGTCARCGGTVRAALPGPGADYVTYEGPIEGPLTGGPLTCEAARGKPPEGTAVTETRTTVNPHAPAQPRLTTWLVIREPVANPAAMHALGLSLGAITASPPQALPDSGAPDAYASMSFTTTDQPGARPRHQAFVLAAGKWLNEQKAPYAWRTGDGSWHTVGGTAR